MKTKLTFIGLSSVIVLGVVLIFALSIEKKEQPATPVDELAVADSIISEIDVDEILDDNQIEEIIPLETAPVETLQVSFANVKDVAIWDDRIVAGTEGGVFTYRVSDSSYQFFYYANGLTDYNVNAILTLGNKLIVGTEGGLSEIDKAGNVIPIDFGFNPPVTALAESNGALLIGTRDDGLIAYEDGTSKQMLELPEISSIVSSGDQIWVASDGHGLFSFDGMKWKKRFLVDDSTAFDCVADLGYKFNRLYAGTAYGMYVFDGGQWNLYNEEDGLLVCDVTEIDFKGWKIIAGTSDWGIYEIFEDAVTPKAWSEGLEVTALASNGQTTVIGTPSDGIYIVESNTVNHINPTPQSFTRPVMALAD
jgi:hypothetical protein